MVDRLRITEIFYSLQGESRTVGFPTVFVRLTGCPLRCHYCDTAYAFSGGDYLSFDEILTEVKSYDTPYVTVTGGEPLVQPKCLELLTRLCDEGYAVSLETSGALDVAEVDSRVVKVMDLKTPKSGEMSRNKWQNLDFIQPRDQIKFVICDRQDYDWARMKIEEFQLSQRCEVLMSPSWQAIEASDLAGWILADKLKVRMQLQLHKLLWGDKPGV
ncbi:MAG TPA: 7-carboxy-7-deazaguanine synthase QueE [Aeromonadales bacterium]|nr:7-carboxy-7-deazaguanine synthase QueE [Aeromonadales bacterium]